MNAPPRYYVREHSGYRTMRCYGNRSRQGVEVMVIDRDYCHRVILSLRGKSKGGPQMLEKRRAAAAERCAALNLEAAREPVSC